jgi:hypothetical protein
MKCENIQFNLSVYADDVLTTNERAATDTHLARCPLCRQKLSEIQSIRNDLRVLARAAMPVDLTASIRNRVSQEIKNAHSSQPQKAFSESVRAWLQMHLLPYGVATVVTFVFAFGLLWTLFSAANHLNQNAEIARAEPFAKSTVLIADNNSFNNSASTPNAENVELTAADFAAARISVSGDSPSVNPKGALIALTKSLVRGKMKDDEVVVVADVFGNGLAQIAEVVEPSGDRKAVGELENALRNNPDYAPFVPAALDGRSETVRVVLKIQCVNVQTHTKKVKN